MFGITTFKTKFRLQSRDQKSILIAQLVSFLNIYWTNTPKSKSIILDALISCFAQLLDFTFLNVSILHFSTSRFNVSKNISLIMEQKNLNETQDHAEPVSPLGEHSPEIPQYPSMPHAPPQAPPATPSGMILNHIARMRLRGE